MRVLLGFCEITGYYGAVKQCLLEYGKECQHYLYVNNNHKFHSNYSKDLITFVIRSLMNIRILLRNKIKKKRYLYLLSELLIIPIVTFLRTVMFLYFICKYNVFILGFKNGFILPNYNNIMGKFCRSIELRILKILKKKVIFVFHGSEIRAPFLDPLHINLDQKRIRLLTHYICQDLEIIEKYADYIISPQGCAHFLKKDFINWSVIGQPININNKAIVNNKRDKKIRILHAPSNTKIKGSRIIRKITNNIKLQYDNVEYKEISNLTNTEVIKEIQKCDIVIDQIYSDMPTTVFAMEAALLGKVVIMGGYELDKMSALIDKKYRLPFIYSKPNNIEDVIMNLLSNQESIHEISQNIYNVTKRYYTANKVINRMIRIINDDIDQDWISHIGDIKFKYGSGINIDRASKSNLIYHDLLYR